MTSSEKVHEPPAAIVPPDKLTEPPPAAAVIVPLPQEPTRLFGAATNRFDGNVSVNATAEIALAAGLLIVNVSVDRSPIWTLPGFNDCVIVGCANNAVADSSE